MNSTSDHPLSARERRQLLDLLDAIVQREASDEQFLVFERWLRDSTDARSTAVRFLHLHSLIERYTSESIATGVDPAGLYQEAGSAPKVSPNPIGIPVARRIGGQNGILRRPVLWSIVGVGVLFIGYFLAISWNMLGREPVDGRSHLAAGDFDLQSPGSDLPTDSVATITASDAAEWSQDSEITPSNPRPRPGAKWPNPGSEIASGQSLSLQTGLVELRLKQGTTLIVEGPAEWTVDGENNATLKRGKLVARVPKSAIGFLLNTPGGRIVDLGTEFGVTVAENDEAEVQVFAGQVAVSSHSRKQGQPQAPRILSTGQTARIVGGDSQGEFVVRDLAGKRTAFTRQVPASRRRVPAYPASLISYWNFDEQNAEGIAWDVCGSNHAQLIDVKRVAGLAGTGGVQFNNADGQVVKLPALATGLNFAEGITIELLFTSSWSGAPLDYDELIRKEGSFTFSFQNDRNDTIDGPVLALEIETTHGSGRLDMPLDGRDGRPTLAALTDGKPHHAVATGDAATGEFAIHVDGKKCFSKIIAPGAAVVVGGDSTPLIGNYSGNLEEPFTGVIDEVALYGRALSPDDISSHWLHIRNGEIYFQYEHQPLVPRTPGTLPAR